MDVPPMERTIPGQVYHLRLRPKNNQANPLKPGQIIKPRFSLNGRAGVFGFYLTEQNIGREVMFFWIREDKGIESGNWKGVAVAR
jgi:hypothetical protein